MYISPEEVENYKSLQLSHNQFNSCKCPKIPETLLKGISLTIMGMSRGLVKSAKRLCNHVGINSKGFRKVASDNGTLELMKVNDPSYGLELYNHYLVAIIQALQSSVPFSLLRDDLINFLNKLSVIRSQSRKVSVIDNYIEKFSPEIKVTKMNYSEVEQFNIISLSLDKERDGLILQDINPKKTLCINGWSSHHEVFTDSKLSEVGKAIFSKEMKNRQEVNKVLESELTKVLEPYGQFLVLNEL